MIRAAVLAVCLFLSTCAAGVAPVFAGANLFDEFGPSTNFIFDQTSIISYQGALDYCERVPDECVGHGREVLEATDELAKKLLLAQLYVNGAIKPGTDLKVHGKDEYWAIKEPGARGDCEDYALTKRDHLIKLGVPAGAMSIVVLEITSRGEDHAILAVHTDRGVYLLDNLQTSVTTLYTPLGYRFESVQAPEDFDKFQPVRGVSN